MKHYKIRAVYRDDDAQITGYGKPKTVPPDLGRAMLNEYPNQWELIDREFEVEDDTRGLRPRRRGKDAMTPLEPPDGPFKGKQAFPAKKG